MDSSCESALNSGRNRLIFTCTQNHVDLLYKPPHSVLQFPQSTRSLRTLMSLRCALAAGEAMDLLVWEMAVSLGILLLSPLNPAAWTCEKDVHMAEGLPARKMPFMYSCITLDAFSSRSNTHPRFKTSNCKGWSSLSASKLPYKLQWLGIQTISTLQANFVFSCSQSQP